MGVGLGPNLNERKAGAGSGLSTAYPQTQTYPQVIHQISTGLKCGIYTTQSKNPVDTRVNSSVITLEQSIAESYSVVESHSVITVYTTVEITA